MLRQNSNINTFSLVLKTIFDSIMTISLAMKFLPAGMMWVSIFWFIAYLSIQLLLKWFVDKSSTPESSGLLLLQALFNFCISLGLTFVQNYIFHKNKSIRKLTKIELIVVILMVFVIKSYPVRYSFFFYLVTIIIYLSL